MAFRNIAALFCLLLAPEAALSGSEPELKDGDLIFQTNVAGQGEAIRQATSSPYTHVGIVFFEKGESMVFEAVATVRFTPLSAWIARGDGGNYIVRRLKAHGEILTPSALKRMQDEASKFKGRAYDLHFLWSDEKIYCSELVWKIYERALGVKLGEPRRFRDYRLDSPIVREKIRERYGLLFPLDELAVSPGDVFDSALLETVAGTPWETGAN